MPPPRRCSTCDRSVVEAIDKNGHALELVQHTGEPMYLLQAIALEMPTGKKYGNLAVRTTLWSQHECTEVRETLASPVRVQEFAPTLGEPVREA